MLALIFVAVFATLPISEGAPHLQPQERRVLEHWLRAHPNLSIATEIDCGQCSEQIAAVRKGYGAAWPAAPSFHPYYVSGDLNGDGVRDFAVAVLDRTKRQSAFVLLVFNGPFSSKLLPGPKFVSEPLELRGSGIFFGPPRPKPYRLVVGPFESDNTDLLVPAGAGYRWDTSGGE
jgi:hypothetical protein